MRLGSERWRRRLGSTLIEVMIAIAILAVFLAIPMTGLDGINSLTREDDYRWALTNARQQKAWLLSANFDRLPPEQLTVARDGSVELSQAGVLTASITVDGKPISDQKRDGARLLLGAERAGQKVTVDYEFTLPHQNEAHFLDDKQQITLQNVPVQKVEAVWLAQGNTLTPARLSEVDLATGRVSFSSLSPGALVVVDYRGERWGNRLSGRFLDDKLEPTTTPTDTKLLEVKEWYGGAWRMTLPLIRVRS